MAQMNAMIDSKVAKYKDIDRKVADAEEYNQIFIKSNKSKKKKAFIRNPKISNMREIRDEVGQLIDDNYRKSHGINNYMADIARGGGSRPSRKSSKSPIQSPDKMFI